MRNYLNIIIAYSIMLLLIILVGIFQSWSIALTIFNYCMISAVMTLGANIQWGYAGLINFGIMGYTALGGLAVVLVSVAPVPEAWSVGGVNMMTCLGIIILMIFSTRYILKNIQKSNNRNYLVAGIIIVGLILVGPRILSAHYGSIYLGKENGVLLGFSVGIICVTFACWKLYIDDWRDDED